MTEPEFFDIPSHSRFLDGYLDAVGRSLTTGVESVQIWLAPDPYVDSAADAGEEWTEVRSWSAEFGAFVEGFLRIDQRSSLGFYLIDYLCWYREFTEAALCFRSSIGTAIYDITYRIEWPDGTRVLLMARRSLLDHANCGPTPAQAR
ncbi:hypothetical protein [Lysobacter antibioticus]|uniref:hypothetical protein n=1 Tax=Lysobacter antibioticus TaxID=84531 RepID=UPI000349BD50|nr:hypothetical protein [Lysobacter antibioticus]